MKQQNRYAQIIESIFSSHYKRGIEEFEFDREEFEAIARKLKIKLPKNLGDIIYSFRYRFVAVAEWRIAPTEGLAETKVPDSTPGIVAMYSFDDEQALLAKLRYNRLIDVFTGVTCYSLQNHLRTYLNGMGQIETDEIYVGLDQRGAHYVFPVQAKGGKDKLSIVQIEQDFALCKEKFPSLICKPIGAQFIEENLIALFGFEEGENGITRSMERHYRLVPPDQITPDDLKLYQERLPAG